MMLTRAISAVAELLVVKEEDSLEVLREIAFDYTETS